MELGVVLVGGAIRILELIAEFGHCVLVLEPAFRLDDRFGSSVFGARLFGLQRRIFLIGLLLDLGRRQSEFFAYLAGHLFAGRGCRLRFLDALGRGFGVVADFDRHTLGQAGDQEEHHADHEVESERRQVTHPLAGGKTRA